MYIKKRKSVIKTKKGHLITNSHIGLETIYRLDHQYMLLF
jgi:hypothetical protein